MDATNFDVLLSSLLDYVYRNPDDSMIGQHSRTALEGAQTNRAIGHVKDILAAPDDPVLLEHVPERL